MVEDKPKKVKAQLLPRGWEPKDVVPWECTAETKAGICGSKATRFVYQHGHKSEGPPDLGYGPDVGRSSVATWELPAYQDDDGTPHKWKCPVCNYEVSPVLVKCAACGYIGPLKQTQQPKEA